VTIASRDVYLDPHGSAANRTEFDCLIGEWIAAGRPEVCTIRPCDIDYTGEVWLYTLEAHRSL
jgi:hypothetical protein